jgi:uncharacterized protein (TIGR03067 family)
MLTPRRSATFALLVFPLAIAMADDKATKGDLAKFQGKWTTQIGPEKNIALKVTFAEQKVTVSGTSPQGDAFEIHGEIKLNDSAKPHKTLDWVKFVDQQGNEIGENLAIYEIVDADTIRICSGGPGGDRPTEFKAGDGGRPSLIVLKREKN